FVDIGLEEDLLLCALYRRAHGGESVVASEVDLHFVAAEERRAVDPPHQRLERRIPQAAGDCLRQVLYLPPFELRRQLSPRRRAHDRLKEAGAKSMAAHGQGPARGSMPDRGQPVGSVAKDRRSML